MAVPTHDDENTPLLPSQFQALPHKKLLVVFPALAFIQFTSFLDQTAIATSLPAIAAGLKTGSSISLVGASFLITSTSIQVINGRLSDIFGRRTCLITALIIMGLGNLLSGFARTPAELFASRAFTGFGAGAINALVQIAISDITTLEQRGYYFGVVGVAVALGNGLGPVVGGYLTELISWRWAFWFVCPLTAVAVPYLMLVWPQSTARENIWEKLKLVDWLGAWTSLAAIVLFLIPISQGGSVLAWTSPIMIMMLTASFLLFATFCLVEWRFATLPIIPAHIFKYSRSTNILIMINPIIGWIFWGNLFCLPLYFQNVRGWSPGKAGLFILPMVIAHGLTSGITGVIMSMYRSYNIVIVTGSVCWMVGVLAKLQYTPSTPVSVLIVVGIFDGIGVGCSLQPVLVGLLAGSHSEDRAVVTGLRNFLRDMGGAIGVTVSGAILSNVLYGGLKSKFDSHTISRLTSAASTLADLDLSDEDKKLVTYVYMKGLRTVFISYLVLIAVHISACLLIKDEGFSRKDEGKASNAQSTEEREGILTREDGAM